VIPHWSRVSFYLQRCLFYGLCALALFLLKNLSTSSAWRAGLIALIILAVIDVLPRARALWLDIAPQARRITLLWVVFVGVVTAMTFIGQTEYSAQTIQSAKNQFFADFLLSASLPILLLIYIDIEGRLKALLYFLLAGTILFAILKNLLQYLQEIQALGRLHSDITQHRGYANALVFGLPVLLFAAHITVSRKWSISYCSLTILTLLLIALTGARGAWLASAIILFLFMLFAGGRKFYIVSGLSLLICLPLMQVVPQTLIVDRIKKGFDTSNRIQGTWLPAIDMIRKRPLSGYGYGMDIFHEQFQKQKNLHKNWSMQRSMGEHNLFLSVGFFSGLPGLLLFLGVLGGVSYYLLRYLGYQRRITPPDVNHPTDYLTGLAIISILFGSIVTHGMVENHYWSSITFCLGLALSWINLRGKASDHSLCSPIKDLD